MPAVNALIQDGNIKAVIAKAANAKAGATTKINNNFRFVAITKYCDRH